MSSMRKCSLRCSCMYAVSLTNIGNFRYLDGLGGKEDDLDFMNDLGNELKEDVAEKKGKKRKAADEEKADENDGDWDDDDVDDEG